MRRPLSPLSPTLVCLPYLLCNFPARSENPLPCQALFARCLHDDLDHLFTGSLGTFVFMERRSWGCNDKHRFWPNFLKGCISPSLHIRFLNCNCFADHLASFSKEPAPERHIFPLMGDGFLVQILSLSTLKSMARAANSSASRLSHIRAVSNASLPDMKIKMAQPL